MFYKIKIKDHIKVKPSLLGEDINTAIIKEAKNKFEGYLSKELGIVIDVSDVLEVGEGVITPGEGSPYYETTLEILSFKPELHEVVQGTVRDIADFGAFLSIGPIDGMVHVSQTMNDYVSFSKEKTLLGKDTKRTLRVGDKCKAKMIAISYKDLNNPKFGLTMRQKGLGKQEWIKEDFFGKPKATKKATKK